jgi:uncharacterized RDD family membrane protein YckC
MAVVQTSSGTLSLPEGVVITSKSRRLLCAMLEVVLVIVTLGIGYFIWQFFTYRHGQTPGKKLMGMRVISLNDGKALAFWMTLLREWVVKPFIGSITFGIAYIWILFDDKNQALYDKVLNTIVVDDPQELTIPAIAIVSQPTTF